MGMHACACMCVFMCVYIVILVIFKVISLLQLQVLKCECHVNRCLLAI